MMTSAATADPAAIQTVLEDVLAVDELPDDAGCSKGTKSMPPLPRVPAAAATWGTEDAAPW